jgi:HSP20 family molecular chaperone IbpA
MSQVEVRALQPADPGAARLFVGIGSLVDLIRQRAYELYQLRAGEGFHELDDWLQAERELLACQRCEVKEIEGRFVAEIDAADFEPGDLRVTVLGSELVIEGNSRRPERTGSLESALGRSLFVRAFLSDVFDASTLKAELHGGVLRVTAEKAMADHTTPPAGGNMPAEGIQPEFRSWVSVATA